MIEATSQINRLLWPIWNRFKRAVKGMIHPVWMIPQLWTSITPGFFFQSLTSPSCHSARRDCPEFQNPLSYKAKGNLLPGQKGPLSGWMRDGEKRHFPKPHPTSGTIPPTRRSRDIIRNDEWKMESGRSHTAKSFISSPQQFDGEKEKDWNNHE